MSISSSHRKPQRDFPQLASPTIPRRLGFDLADTPRRKNKRASPLVFEAASSPVRPVGEFNGFSSDPSASFMHIADDDDDDENRLPFAPLNNNASFICPKSPARLGINHSVHSAGNASFAFSKSPNIQRRQKTQTPTKSSSDDEWCSYLRQKHLFDLVAPKNGNGAMLSAAIQILSTFAQDINEQVKFEMAELTQLREQSNQMTAVTNVNETLKNEIQRCETDKKTIESHLDAIVSENKQINKLYNDAKTELQSYKEEMRNKETERREQNEFRQRDSEQIQSQYAALRELETKISNLEKENCDLKDKMQSAQPINQRPQPTTLEADISSTQIESKSFGFMSAAVVDNTPKTDGQQQASRGGADATVGAIIPNNILQSLSESLPSIQSQLRSLHETISNSGGTQQSSTNEISQLLQNLSEKHESIQQNFNGLLRQFESVLHQSHSQHTSQLKEFITQQWMPQLTTAMTKPMNEQKSCLQSFQTNIEKAVTQLCDKIEKCSVPQSIQPSLSASPIKSDEASWKFDFGCLSVPSDTADEKPKSRSAEKSFSKRSRTKKNAAAQQISVMFDQVSKLAQRFDTMQLTEQLAPLNNIQSQVSMIVSHLQSDAQPTNGNLPTMLHATLQPIQNSIDKLFSRLDSDPKAAANGEPPKDDEKEQSLSLSAVKKSNRMRHHWLDNQSSTANDQTSGAAATHIVGQLAVIEKSLQSLQNRQKSTRDSVDNCLNAFRDTFEEEMRDMTKKINTSIIQTTQSKDAQQNTLTFTRVPPPRAARLSVAKGSNGREENNKGSGSSSPSLFGLSDEEATDLPSPILVPQNENTALPAATTATAAVVDSAIDSAAVNKAVCGMSDVYEAVLCQICLTLCADLHSFSHDLFSDFIANFITLLSVFTNWKWIVDPNYLATELSNGVANWECRSRNRLVQIIRNGLYRVAKDVLSDNRTAATRVHSRMGKLMDQLRTTEKTNASGANAVDISARIGAMPFSSLRMGLISCFVCAILVTVAVSSFYFQRFHTGFYDAIQHI